MQTIGMNYDVKPERVDEFVDYSLNVLEAMKGFDGHIETRLFSDVIRPNSLMIYSNWESVEQFKLFVRSDAFKQAVGETVDMWKVCRPTRSTKRLVVSSPCGEAINRGSKNFGLSEELWSAQPDLPEV